MILENQVQTSREIKTQSKMALPESEVISLLMVKQTQLEMMRDRGFDISEEKNILDYDPTDEEHIDEFRNYIDPKPGRSSKKNAREQLSRKYTKLVPAPKDAYNPDDQKKDPTERNSSKGTQPVNYIPMITAVYYLAHSGEAAISADAVRSIMEEWATIKYLMSVILIAKYDLSTGAEKVLSGIGNAKHSEENHGIRKTYSVQYFLESELHSNPIKHITTPTYKILTTEEKNKLLQTRGIHANQLPTFKYVDFNTRIFNKTKKDRISDPVVDYFGLEPEDVVMVRRRNYITDSLVDVSIHYRRVSY